MIRYTNKDRDNDFKWFDKHRDEFHEKYGNCYVATRHQETLGIFQNMDEGIEKISKIYPHGTFLVQHCTDNEAEYTCRIYSPVMGRIAIGL